MRQPNSSDDSAVVRETESVIVVGIVRNIEKSFAKDIERLSKALKRFTNIDWFLVESGSSDQSITVLERFSKELSNFSFQHVAIEHSATRTENMATARNKYLDYLREESRLNDYQYIVIADFNNLNSTINHEVVESCFKKLDWDVVTANQSGRYYDAWALRHPLWSPNDCWEQHEFFRKYTRFPESAITYSQRYVGAEMGGDLVEGVDFSQTPRMNVDASHQNAEEPVEETKEEPKRTDINIDPSVVRVIWPYLRPTEPIPSEARIKTDIALITELFDELVAKKKQTE
jgi:hypothetical protein